MATALPETPWCLLLGLTGEHFSELGRASLIEDCLASWQESPDAALAWAACGHDVAVLDMKKLEAELVAEHIEPGARGDIIARVNRNVATAKKVGAFVEQAAKDDPGIAAILQLGDAARTEWATFASANREAIDRHLALKDAVRSGKTNDKGFDGCYEATKGPFAPEVVEGDEDPLRGVGRSTALLLRAPHDDDRGVRRFRVVCRVRVRSGSERRLALPGRGEPAGRARADRAAFAHGGEGLRGFVQAEVRHSHAEPHPDEESLQVRDHNDRVHRGAADLRPGGGVVATAKADEYDHEDRIQGRQRHGVCRWRKATKPNGTGGRLGEIREVVCATRVRAQREVGHRGRDEVHRRDRAGR